MPLLEFLHALFSAEKMLPAFQEEAQYNMETPLIY